MKLSAMLNFLLITTATALDHYTRTVPAVVDRVRAAQVTADACDTFAPCAAPVLTDAADADVYGLTSRGGSVVTLGVRERPRGFGRGDAVDVRDDAFIAFAFDANRFAQATASLARPAAEYPGAFGAAGRARFLEARRAASPLKTSRGVACVVAGPPKPLAPIRTARLPNGGGGS